MGWLAMGWLGERETLERDSLRNFGRASSTSYRSLQHLCV